VIADVFGCDVFTMASPGGAPLGAAYRALHAVKSAEAGAYVPYGEVRRPRSEGAARPVTS
jgi:sugar (pentulose or hexulose) kinase